MRPSAKPPRSIKKTPKFRYYLYLIVPMFARNKEIEKKRSTDFREWSIHKFENKMHKLRVKHNYMIGECGDEERQGGVSKKYDRSTGKGKLIREKISGILSDIEGKPSLFRKTFIIAIDGTGRIEYDSIITVLKSLISGEQVVLSCRMRKFAISRARKPIELFENFLVSEKYKVHLPDGQCGCWGFRMDVKNNFSFDSEKYSVELELLINALEKSLNFCFVPIKTIPNKNTSSFKIVDSLYKLNFLAKSLKIDRFDLIGRYEKFKKEKRTELPSGYTALFKRIRTTHSYSQSKCKGICNTKCPTPITKIK